MKSTISDKPTASRRLIGHSQPVYNVSFSRSIAAPKLADPKTTPSTAPLNLLSCSADGTVRLWSLKTFACLATYKGHEKPVFDVRWSPMGHYFATAGWDKTVRIWAMDKIGFLRLCVGHTNPVMKVAWHPNGAYVLSSSDGEDKAIRMWSIATGECVRIFAGHTGDVSTLECMPNGKWFASGDYDGTIIVWDLESGLEVKRCKGHGKNGIYSISFNGESKVMVSGGADGTVRSWDVDIKDGHQQIDGGGVVGQGGQSDATRVNINATSGTGGGKKKSKETTITPDQLGAFPTKKTPVYKVMFTRMNLVMAAGCYAPN